MKTPFTIEQFFDVIKDYNISLFPFQLIIIILVLIGFILLFGKNKYRSNVISILLGFLWIWGGIMYHFLFFTTINKAAYIFGGLFIVQGIFFFIELIRGRLYFLCKRSVRHYVGYFFILFGLIIYPLISYLVKGNFDETISLGLPCPTTILTFGFLLLSGKGFSKYLLIIPTIWAIIGTGAAINFGVYQDYLMIISAVVADIYLLGRTKGNSQNITNHETTV